MRLSAIGYCKAVTGKDEYGLGCEQGIRQKIKDSRKKEAFTLSKKL
jgi:hypothetical protein